MRAPNPELLCPTQGNSNNTYFRRTRWRGARIFRYVDDFLLFAATEEEALTLRQRLANLLDRLGLLRHPTKGFWTPPQIGHRIGTDINTASCYFYAPESKLIKIEQQAKQLLIGRATRYSSWLPVKDLQSLAGQAQYLFLTIYDAIFFLFKLHSVVGEKWGGLIRQTPELCRDLPRWR
jgi:hypothetical protein